MEKLHQVLKGKFQQSAIFDENAAKTCLKSAANKYILVIIKDLGVGSMISIQGSLSFAKLVMMSFAPTKSAGDARYGPQDPFIHSCNQHCPIQSRLQSILGVRSFFVELNYSKGGIDVMLNTFLRQGGRDAIRHFWVGTIFVKVMFLFLTCTEFLRDLHNKLLFHKR